MKRGDIEMHIVRGDPAAGSVTIQGGRGGADLVRSIQQQLHEAHGPSPEAEQEAARQIAAQRGVALAMVLRVSHSGGKPIIRFDRRKHAVPEGATLVLIDGAAVHLWFQKIAVNVATDQAASGKNVLPDRLRALFGPDAGLPGTRHDVLLEKMTDGSWQLSKLSKAGA